VGVSAQTRVARLKSARLTRSSNRRGIKSASKLRSGAVTPTANTADLEALLNRIRQIDGVERTFTSIVLLTHFERGVNFLEEE